MSSLQGHFGFLWTSEAICILPTVCNENSCKCWVYSLQPKWLIYLKYRNGNLVILHQSRFGLDVTTAFSICYRGITATAIRYIMIHKLTDLTFTNFNDTYTWCVLFFFFNEWEYNISLLRSHLETVLKVLRSVFIENNACSLVGVRWGLLRYNVCFTTPLQQNQLLPTFSFLDINA